MYLHFKGGFIEADRWSGDPTNDKKHDARLKAAMNRSENKAVVVVRARDRDTLVMVLGLIGIPALAPRYVLESPPGWDYEWRTYLSVEEFGEFMEQVAFGLDYRNFKTYCSVEAKEEYRLAHDIWTAAYRSAPR